MNQLFGLLLGLGLGLLIFPINWLLTYVPRRRAMKNFDSELEKLLASSTRDPQDD